MPKSQINLLPQEEFEKKPLGKFLTWALSAGRWIVTFTELIVIIAFLSRFKLDRDIADLHDQIKQKQTIIQSSSGFEKEFRFLHKRIAEIKNLESKKTAAIPIFVQISKFVPADVLLTKFSLTTEGNEIQLSISGNALSEEGLGSFLAGLTNSPNFTDINLATISKSADQTENGLKFSLTAKVQKGGAKKNAS